MLAAIGFAMPAAPACAQMTYTAGDLLLGFQATAGDGSSSTYVYNLGAGTGFRSHTSTGQIANLKADLDTIFGEGWYGRNNIYWGIAGVRDPAGSGPNTVVNGDPRAAIYLSKAASIPGTSTAWDLPASSATSSPTTISVASSIATMQGGFLTITGETTVTPLNRRTPTANSNGRGTEQLTSDINSWDEFNPVAGAAFGGYLTGGVQGQLGSANAQTHLDLYRLLGRSSASATPNTPVGDGLLVGTFSITAQGLVTFAAAAAASAYDTWADSFSLVGADRAGTADPEKDGIANYVEFVIGGNPKTGSDADKMPTLSPISGEAVQFVFRRADAAAYLNPRAEYDADLLGAWTPAIPSAVTVVNDGFGVGIDRVTVTVPAPDPIQFVRLRVGQ